MKNTQDFSHKSYLSCEASAGAEWISSHVRSALQERRTHKPLSWHAAEIYMLVCLFTSLTRRETGKAGNLAQLHANGDALTLHIAVLHLRWWTELQLEDAVVKVFVGLFLMPSKESSSSDFKMIIFLSLCFTPDFMKIYIYTCHNKYCIGIDFFCWHVERFQQVKQQPSSDWSKAVCVSWWILYLMKKKLFKIEDPWTRFTTAYNTQQSVCLCVCALLCSSLQSSFE